MKKKLLAALLSLTMVASLAACGGNGGNGGSGSAGGSGDAASVDTKEHVVINYMTTGDPPEAGSEKEQSLNDMLAKLNAILTEKVNAEIKMYYIPWTDYLSNYNLTLARMDGSVDLVGTACQVFLAQAVPHFRGNLCRQLVQSRLELFAIQFGKGHSSLPPFKRLSRRSYSAVRRSLAACLSRSSWAAFLALSSEAFALSSESPSEAA